MKRILVIGDAFADVYTECMFKKMCPDAPEAPAVIKGHSDVRPGGAANVAVNLARLVPAQTQVDLISVMDDELARNIKRISENRVDMEYCAWVDRTLHKQRFVVHGKPSIRVDDCNFSSYTAERVSALLKSYLANHDPDLVLYSDYAAGTVDTTTLQLILSMRDRLLVDTKHVSLNVFDGTLGIKLNESEWKTILKYEHSPERFFQFMVVTLGERGAELWRHEQVGQNRSVTHRLPVKGLQVTPVDVCGCGDTFLAGMAASLIRNDDIFTALQFANVAAALVVTQVRTAVTSRSEVLRVLGWEIE